MFAYFRRHRLTLPIPIFFTGVTTYLQLMRADELSIPGLRQVSSR